MNQAILDQAKTLDSQDTLAPYREQFHFPLDDQQKALRYFCGHSLGLQPKTAKDMVQTALDSWQYQGVDGHFEGGKPWLTYLDNLNPKMASLVGAKTAEVTVMNALSVNLHLLLASFYHPKGKRTKIVIEQAAFPSDRYAVLSQLQWHGLDSSHLIELAPAPGKRIIEEAQLEQLLDGVGDEIALVMFPGVQYITGQFFDLQRITNACHKAGVIAGFDLAHAAGNIDIQLHESGADFAAWCGYKYLNGGPGTLSGCFIHERHHDNAAIVKLAGWWSNNPNTRFDMASGIDWAPGADAWQISNPPILSTAPLLAALDIHTAVGMPALREKSVRLTGFLENLINTLLADDCEIITPIEPERRGTQLSVVVKAGTERGKWLYEQLRTKGFICDWRNPDIIRIAPVPMYNSFTDVAELILTMQALLQE